MAFCVFTRRHKKISIMKKVQKKTGRGRGAKTETVEEPVEVLYVVRETSVVYVGQPRDSFPHLLQFDQVGK